MSSGSSDSSGTSTGASDETSSTTDTGQIKPVIKVIVKDNKGSVVVGGRSAKIHRQKTKGGKNRDLPIASSSTTQSQDPLNGTSPAEESRKQERVQNGNVIQNSEYIPGTYFQRERYKPQYGERERRWNPRPDNGILINKGDKELQWSIESFMDNPDQFIQEMDISVGLRKEQREQFIIHVLKHLEKSWGRCSSSNDEVYKILGKISCSVNSGTVVRHALRLLFYLICKDHFDNGNRNLLVIEAISRSSIFSSEGMFKKDQHSEQNLKLLVYSRILSLMLVQHVRRETLSIEALGPYLKKAQEELRGCCVQIKNKKKDVFRYSMEFILKVISCLLKPHHKLKTSTRISGFLDECQEFCVNPRMESKELKILKTLGKKKNVDVMKSGEWSDLHCIFIYLHGKVHSERPAPQMDTERRAMNLIRLIVEAYLQGGGGADWRFCLLASTILVDIAKNNVTEEIMKEAGCCLVNLLKDVKVQKRPECIALLEQRSSELLFCPDSKTRTLLVHFLSKNQNVQDALPIELHIDHLTSIYRTQTLEIDTDPTIYGKEYVIKEGMFQSRKVAVKILPVKRQHLLEEEHKFQSRERLIREAYSLKRLNASQHRNLPVLLCYDTRNFPYHIITVYETYGDLLHFVKRSRTRIPHLQPIQLLKMLIDVSDALSYLKGLDLVHRAVMAENVLVGDSNVCKISGLNALKPLTCGTSKEGVESASLYDYCSADDGVPDFVSTDNEEDLPVRWKAPECLTENRYSTASDVWAFGVLMYEVLTYGCIPYRHVLDDDEVSSRVLNGKEILPPEPCFEDKEYELIKQCCEWQLTKRISLPEVSDRLKEMLENADEDESRPDPPALEMLQSVAGSSDFENQEELVYSSIPDHIDEDNLQVGDRPFSKTYEGFTVICERISGGDFQHMRGLLSLKNPCLASISQLHRLESPCMVVEIISPATLFGNLKEYVLNRRCQQEEIVAYLSQVASALHYLHTKHIVHGDLRAVYVNVAAPDKVQVGRLGRSSTLSMSEYDVTSTSCVKRADMPPDSIRWSAPEVILDGLYTHASDVWAFGILAWELYTSFTTGQDGRDFSTPYFGLQDDMILLYMRNERPLDQPEGCPDWVYNIMHQCWAYDSVQRPPFLAILDCLTSREPMESWIMKLWLQNHHESEWPDLSIRQTDAYHVTDTDKHPTRENIEKMCPADFFIKHHYKYVDTSSVHVEDDEYDASCSSRESTLERSQGYHEPCIDRSVKMKKPVKGDECRGSKITHYTSADVPLCKTYHRHSVTTSEALSEANDEATSRSYPEVMQEGYEEYYEELPASMYNETSDHLCSLEKEGAESGESVVTKPRSYNENAARLGTRSELLSASNEDPYGCSYPEVMEQEFHEPTTPVYNGTPSYTSAVERKGKKCNKNDFMKPHSCSEETDLHRRSMKGREELSASNDEELLESVTELTYDDREPFSPESQEDATDTLFYSSVDVPECKGSHETRRLSGNKHTASYGRSVRKNEALSTCYDATSGYSHPEEESPAPMFHDTSGYLCPVEQRGDEGNDTKCLPCKDLTSDGLHYSSVDVQRSTRSHSSNGHQYNEDITPPKRSVRKSKPPSTSNDNTSCHSQPEKMEEDFETPMALMHNGTSGFPDPVKMEGDISNDNKHRPLDDISSNSLHYTSADVVGCNETCEADHSSKTRNKVSYSELTLKKKCSIQYQTLTFNLDSNDSSQRKNNTRLTEHQNAIKLDDDDSSSYDDVNECITEDRTHFEELSKDDTHLSEYQNTACKLNDDDNYDDVIGFITEDRTRFEEFSKNEYQNMECKLDEDDNYDDVIGFLTQDNTHLVEFSADNTSIGEYQNMTCKLDKLQRNTEDNPQHGEYLNMANKLDQGDFSIYDKPQQSTEDNTHLVEYQNATCALDQGDTSMYDKRNTEGNPQHGEYQNMTNKLDQSDFSMNDKPQQRTEDNTHLVEYQTTECALDRGDSSMYDNANLAEYESMACAMDHDDSSVNNKRQRHTEDNILLDEYQNMSCKLNKSVRSLEEKGKTQFKHQREVCAYQNSAHHRTFPFGVLTKGIRKNTPGSQATKKRKSHLGKNKENVHENSGLHHVHVPRGEHVYANVRTAVEGSNSSIKGALQDHSFLDKLNDPDLDTIYF